MANEVKTVLTADVSGFTSDMIKAEKSTTEFGNSMTKAGSKSNTLKGALRQATKEAMDLSLQMSKMSQTELNSDLGRQMQAQFQQALQEAGNFKDQMEDVNRTIKNLASDTARWDAAKEGINVLSSSMQGLAGVVGLCGGDVTAFTKALATMNTIQQVVNTVITIGNALQKESALMTQLRTNKIKAQGVAQAAANVKEAANTAAIQANTGAINTNKAALMRHPIGLIVTLLTTAAAAILMNSEAWQKLTGAIDENEQEVFDSKSALDKETQTVEQNKAMLELLRKKWDELGNDLNAKKQFIELNREELTKLGIVTNSVNGVEAAMHKNANAVIKMWELKAQAAALYAEQQYYLGKQIEEVAAIEEKARKGEITRGELKKYYKDPGSLVGPGYVPSGWNMFRSSEDEKFTVTGRELEGLRENVKLFGTYSKRIDDVNKKIQANNEEMLNLKMEYPQTFGKITDSADKATTATNKTAKSTKEVKTALEKLDEEIKKVEKSIASLDKSTDGYQKKLNELKSKLVGLKLGKLDFLDLNSLSGLVEARNLLQEIQDIIPENDKNVENVNDLLATTDEQLLNIVKTLKDDANGDELEQLESIVTNIIKSIPQGTEAWKMWANVLRDIKNKATELDEELKKILEDDGSNSEANLQKRLNRLQSERSQQDPTTEKGKKEIERLNGLIQKTEEAIKLTKELGRSESDVYEILQNEYFSSLDSDLADLQSNVKAWLSKMPEAGIQLNIEVNEAELNRLNAELEKHVKGSEEWYRIKDSIEDVTKELHRYKKELMAAELVRSYNEKVTELGFADYDSIKSGTDALHSLYDAVANLPDRLDECKNGFEGFFEIMSAGFSIIDSIVSFIENINKIIELIQTLTATKEALGIVTKSITGSEVFENIAIQENVAATGEKMGVDSAAAGASAEKVAAAKAEEAAMLDLAAASIYAAHAYIPFAGVGIASGFVATMMSEMAAVHAASVGMQALAEGGIVQGSTTVGDRVYARLNAGEAVLTKNQQSRLFKLIDRGEVYGGGPTASIVRVKGSDLYIALKNYSKVTGKTSLGNIGAR